MPDAGDSGDNGMRQPPRDYPPDRSEKFPPRDRRDDGDNNGDDMG